jgi:hypothetical protein
MTSTSKCVIPVYHVADAHLIINRILNSFRAICVNHFDRKASHRPEMTLGYHLKIPTSSTQFTTRQCARSKEIMSPMKLSATIFYKCSVTMFRLPATVRRGL